MTKDFEDLEKNSCVQSLYKGDDLMIIQFVNGTYVAIGADDNSLYEAGMSAIYGEVVNHPKTKEEGKIVLGSSYDDYSLEPCPRLLEDLENERQKRVEEDIRNKKYWAERERKQYLELKAKFEPEINKEENEQ